MRVRLLREAGGLGDIVCTLYVAAAVKEKLPSAVVGHYTLPEYTDLVSQCMDVDEVFSVDFAIRRDRDQFPDPKLYRYLREGRYVWDATVDLFCPGWRHEMETRGRPIYSRVECMLHKASQVLRVDLGISVPKFRDDVLARYAVSSIIPADRSLIGVQPQASAKERECPEDFWEAVVRELEGNGYSVIVYATHGRWKQFASRTGVLCSGRMSANMLVASLRRCSCVVGVDSGVMHLASALGIRTVWIFGPTSGYVTCRPYPLASYIEAGLYCTRIACEAPCYYLPSRGFRPSCRAEGCVILKQYEKFFEEFLAAIDKSPL